jgi:hypothetical protein
MQIPSFLPPKAVLLLLYGYIPNKGAAIVAVLLYILVSIAVTAVTVKTKSWYMLVVTLAAILELAGKGSPGDVLVWWRYNHTHCVYTHIFIHIAQLTRGCQPSCHWQSYIALYCKLCRQQTHHHVHSIMSH